MALFFIFFFLFRSLISRSSYLDWWKKSSFTSRRMPTHTSSGGPCGEIERGTTERRRTHEKRRINELLWKMKRVKVSRSMRNVCSIHSNMFLASEDVFSTKKAKNPSALFSFIFQIHHISEWCSASSLSTNQRRLLSMKMWSAVYQLCRSATLYHAHFRLALHFLHTSASFLSRVYSRRRQFCVFSFFGSNEREFFWILLRFSDSWWDRSCSLKCLHARGQWTFVLGHTQKNKSLKRGRRENIESEYKLIPGPVRLAWLLIFFVWWVTGVDDEMTIDLSLRRISINVFKLALSLSPSRPPRLKIILFAK